MPTIPSTTADIEFFFFEHAALLDMQFEISSDAPFRAARAAPR